MVSVKTIQASGVSGVLESEADVDNYLAALRTALVADPQRRKANHALMETAPLKSFATSARTELIREVGARITAVLAQGSPERVEQPKAVTALERAIAGGGGGDKGKAHVADKVAYTWFNRIIALRFMDANGYTGIGVVSPAADQVGQPEVLAAAKRGQVDKDVVKGTNAATITGLLNGTRQPRPGVDAQAEAYALLLADYCRFWNTAMPFMFEREGDYTELLIPANLLADDSVLSRSVTVLTEDVCQDVEVIGWLYQFYISERKDEVFAGFKKNKKAGADEIPAATQLFTPHWIVRYLVENSLGRLWMLNRPSSRSGRARWTTTSPRSTRRPTSSRSAKPEELKVIDPACGSGHMLTYAFDLLYAIYEEEGYAPSEIPGLILANNLYGTEIDPRAGALAAFALTMKAVAKRKLFLKNPVEPNICVLDPISFSPDELSYLVTKDGDRHAEEAFWNQFAEADTFGSLIKPDPALTARLARHLETLDDGGDMLQGRRPRLGAAGRSPGGVPVPAVPGCGREPALHGQREHGPGSCGSLRSRTIPTARQDLYRMFVERALAAGPAERLRRDRDRCDIWMFIDVVRAASRAASGARLDLRRLVHLGTSRLRRDLRSVTTAFVFASAARQTRVSTVRSATCELARTSRGADAQLHALRGAVAAIAISRSTSDFAGFPGADCLLASRRHARRVREASRRLRQLARCRTGSADRGQRSFLRFWWEVSSPSNFDAAITRRSDRGAGGSRTTRAGQFRRWYGNQDYVVNWENDGQRDRVDAVRSDR